MNTAFPCGVVYCSSTVDPAPRLTVPPTVIGAVELPASWPVNCKSVPAPAASDSPFTVADAGPYWLVTCTVSPAATLKPGVVGMPNVTGPTGKTVRPERPPVTLTPPLKAVDAPENRVADSVISACPVTLIGPEKVCVSVGARSIELNWMDAPDAMLTAPKVELKLVPG